MIDSNRREQGYIHAVYRNITLLGCALHIVYLLMFIVLGYTSACLYNIFSVLFYIAMVIHVIRKQRYALEVTLVHIEVMLFVVVMTVMFGWNSAYFMFLVAMATLVYFCPFQQAYVPYIFSFAHIVVFFLLRFYTSSVPPLEVAADGLLQVIFICNSISSFVVILYVAYVSKVSTVVDRKALLKENQNLEELANYDQLTGLYSRRYLKECYSFAHQNNDYLAIGDIDDFKFINDTYGHICGDAILRELAELMRSQLDPNVFLCRWGGEEFVFVFPDMKKEYVEEQLQSLCAAIDAYAFVYQEQTISITMTFGLSRGNTRLALSDWIEQGDKRLYKGKRSGKNRVITE